MDQQPVPAQAAAPGGFRCPTCGARQDWADICRRCAWLGVELDSERNAAHGPRITTGESRLPVYVIPTDEELMIARHTLTVLRAQEDSCR